MAMKWDTVSETAPEVGRYYVVRRDGFRPYDDSDPEWDDADCIMTALAVQGKNQSMPHWRPQGVPTWHARGGIDQPDTIMVQSDRYILLKEFLKL
jgi:hypothetical protein